MIAVPEGEMLRWNQWRLINRQSAHMHDGLRNVLDPSISTGNICSLNRISEALFPSNLHEINSKFSFEPFIVLEST